MWSGPSSMLPTLAPPTDTIPDDPTPPQVLDLLRRQAGLRQDLLGVLPRRGAALAAAPLSLSRIAGPGPIARPSISTTEWRRQADGIAPARLLDLHHLGPEVGQEQRAVVAGQEARDVDDPDALERQAHPGGSTGTSSIRSEPPHHRHVTTSRLASRTSSSSTVSSPAIEKW